jgi:hypothetical protein
MEVTVKDFIFCDDIRTEEGKKYSVMGVYADKMRITLRNPQIQKLRVPISSFIRLETKANTKNQNYSFELSVKFNNADCAKAEGNLNFGEENFLILPITRLEFELTKSGILNFALTIKSKDRIILVYEEVLNVILERISAQ